MSKIKAYVSADGVAQCNRTVTTWAAVRDETGTTDVTVSAADRQRLQVGDNVHRGGTDYINMRAFFCIDTSGIKDKPKSATLYIHGYVAKDTDLIMVEASQPGVGGTLTTADYDAIVGLAAGATMDGNVRHYSATNATGRIPVSSWDTSDYNAIPLNDDALADIASKDRFQFALINYPYDYLNNAPTSGTETTGLMLVAASSESDRPYIEYKPRWDYKEDSSPQYDSHEPNFDSNKYKKLSREYKRTTSQIPFSKGIKGPANLRGRNTAYTATKG